MRETGVSLGVKCEFVEGLETPWVAGLWVIVNLKRAGLGDLGKKIFFLVGFNWDFN